MRVIKGRVLDVTVDLRIGSETFGKSFSIILYDVEHRQLFVPRGFDYGFKRYLRHQFSRINVIIFITVLQKVVSFIMTQPYP